MRKDGVRARFETEGPSWHERANKGELGAVLSPGGSTRRNKFLHGVNLFGARMALRLNNHRGILLDFGCGTGRFIRFFGARGYSVIGTEITNEMLREAHRLILPNHSVLILNDGISIPVTEKSVDMIWICGVLKYSLFVPNPAYRQIAEEMYRVLKPGGIVVNLEMYVEAPAEVFTRDFESVGFITKQVRILQRYSRLEGVGQSSRMPLGLVDLSGQVCAALRFWFDHPNRPLPSLRDYLFVWSKPEV